MKQNIINLIISSFFIILFLACGTSDNSGLSNLQTNQPENNDKKKDQLEKDTQKNTQKINQIFTSSNEVSVQENQFSAITLKATGNQPITYFIDGEDSDKFDINNNTGVVTFKTKPDYETKSSYKFKATAKSAKGDNAILDITITIIDVDEIPPKLISFTEEYVKENQLNAITLKATDENKITYSISGEDSDKFNINPQSGVVTFKIAPDYERQRIYSFNATMSDIKGNTTTKTITINIINIVDETKPQWIMENIVSVQENRLNAITLQAINKNKITYSISGKDSSSFNLNINSGVVTFKIAPDYEAKSSYNFIAKATSVEGVETIKYITISILDIDEIAPILTSSNKASVQENQLNAITLKATDENKITYSISGEDSDKFDINNNTGIITFKIAPDYEIKKIYNFNAIISDTLNNITTQNIIINIIDIVDEIKPIWVSSNKVDAKEDQLNAITLKATDENNITYSISGEDSDKFDINNSTGVITFKKKPNYQLKSSYNFIAKATDESNNSTTQNITINIIFVSRLVKTFQGHVSSVHALATFNEKYILSGSGDNTLKIWDINKKKLIRTLKKHAYYVFSLAITLDGKYFLSGGLNNELYLWDINTEKLIRTFKGHIDTIHSIILTTNGKYILSGGGYQDKTIKLWNINTSQLIRSFEGHTGNIYTLAITPNGKYFLSGSNDTTINLWDIDTGVLIRTFKAHTRIINSVAVTLNGKYFLSGSDDKTIKLWDINTGVLIRTFKGHTSGIRSITITPNGKYVLSGSNDKTIKLWDINTGILIRTFKGHTDNISSIITTPDGKYVLSGSWDHTIKVWNLR